MRFVSGLCAVALTALACFSNAVPAKDVDDVPSPDRKAWMAYQQNMFDALSTSQDPHDWVIASIIHFAGSSASERKAGGDLLERAAQALPDDAPTQWLAIQLCPTVKTPPVCDSAMTTLERIEPDNAAVWLQALNRAALLRDVVGVEVALERMAASTHFDDHLLDFQKRLVVVYQRFPPTSAMSDDLHRLRAGFSEANFGYVAAIAITNAMMLPTYQHLIRACTIDAELGLHVERSADCAKVGRMLGLHGPNLVANRIGFAVLRVSRTWNDADVQAAREVDWAWMQAPRPNVSHSATVGMQYEQDWANSGSEIGALRLAMSREGVATLPPADWVDNSSPFSEKRLADDRRYAAEHAANPF